MGINAESSCQKRRKLEINNLRKNKLSYGRALHKISGLFAEILCIYVLLFLRCALFLYRLYLYVSILYCTVYPAQRTGLTCSWRPGRGRRGYWQGTWGRRRRAGSFPPAPSWWSAPPYYQTLPPPSPHTLPRYRGIYSGAGGSFPPAPSLPLNLHQQCFLV